MYDELVKRLRELHPEEFGDAWDFAFACQQAMHESADAIEELTGFVQEAERDRDEYRERLDKANDAIEELSAAEKKYLANISALETKNQHLKRERYWIPATERLPEEYENVLCYYEYFRYGDYNCMFRTIDRGYYGDGRWGGEAGQGHKNKVLAWMPLPEPPKEESYGV